MRILITLLLAFAVALSAVECADRVHVQIYAMSKCPDCASFVQFFSYIHGQLSEIMDVDMDYVASYDKKTKEVSCMHGESECEGNKYELCAQKKYTNNSAWFPFVACSDSDYSSIPSNMQECAVENHMDWDALQKCSNTEGDDLLYKSVVKSSEAGIKWAPTAVLGNGSYVCTWHEPSCFSTDHGEWIKAICGLYKGPSPPQCNSY